eukprot:768572-Hanusia_phi.AAC.5
MQFLRDSKALEKILGLSDSSELTFSAASSQGSYLMELEHALHEAMAEESYERAREIRQEMSLLLQPSQRAQREMERASLDDMRRQVGLAVHRRSLLKNVKKLAGRAVETWKTISGGDLTFVGAEEARREGGGSEGQVLVESESANRDHTCESEARSERETGREEQEQEQEQGRIPEEKDEFESALENFYISLSTSPPRLEETVRLVLELDRVVQSSDDDEVRGELIHSCKQKAIAAIKRSFVEICDREEVDKVKDKLGDVSLVIEKTSEMSNSWKTGRALSLFKMSACLCSDEIFFLLLSAVTLKTVTSEARARAQRIEGALRLAQSVEQGEGGGGGGGGGHLKSDDPLYVMSVQEIFNVVASILSQVYILPHAPRPPLPPSAHF